MIDPIGPNAIIQDPDRLRKLTLLDIPFNNISFMDYARCRLGWVPETQEHLDRLDKGWPWKAKMANVLTLYKEVLMCKDFIEIRVPNHPKLIKAAAEYLCELAGITVIEAGVGEAAPVVDKITEPGNFPVPEVGPTKEQTKMQESFPEMPVPGAAEIPPIESTVSEVEQPSGLDSAAANTDASGMPWDARIHSSGKTTLKSGARKACWKYKKGITDAYIAEVEAELMGAAPTIGEMVVNEVPDLPVPEVAAALPTPSTFVELVQYKRSNTEWITPDIEETVMSTFGLESIRQVPEAAKGNPTLISEVYTMFEAMRG